MKYQSEYLTILGARVHLRRAGKGKPLLFLHGAGGVPVWLPFYDKLAANFELLVPDHPGFGESDLPPWLRNINDTALYYLDFIEALKLRNLDIVGASLGGWIAAEIAVRDSAALRSLCLIGPAGIRVKGIPCGDGFIWSPEEYARNLYYDQAIAERVLKAPMTSEQQDIQIKNRFTTARLAYEPRFYNPDLERWLHRVKPPVQLIWGDSDKVMPPQYATAWQQALPKSKLLVVPKSGHLPQVEHPDAVAACIKTFIGEVAS